ncbi:hypothetical protein LAZ67_2005468 [Cordylochernes scorpioides]|uniref:Mos1 transposase HTH domain-containing protein n=1 Tax=Cordylochernes scorpioides TaxID=51811 RepID=A0ABY6K4L5_9ARAC|nr:hypothetical protein LAZ67_2005468 [Cordylochernes scorpioides]
MFCTLPPELTEHLTPYPKLDAARRIAHERTQTKHLRDKRTFDKQHKAPHFEPGDLVLVKIYQHPNTGPYEILDIVSPNVVRINRPNLPLNRKTDTVHVNKLQYYNENIRYIAPPTIANTRSAHGSATLNHFRHLTPDLFQHNQRLLEANTSQPFRHLLPDLFTATRFAPGLETITTSIPSNHQCNVASPRNVPQHVPPIQTLVIQNQKPSRKTITNPNPSPTLSRILHKDALEAGDLSKSLYSYAQVRSASVSMELPLVNVSTCELRSVIRFFTAKNETAVNIHRNLVSVYGEGCMSIQMVRRWRSWFLEGRQNVHDDERSDRPVTATDNAAVAAVRNVVEANRRVTIDEIMIRLPPGIEIGCSSIGTIMSDVLNLN